MPLSEQAVHTANAQAMLILPMAGYAPIPPVFGYVVSRPRTPSYKAGAGGEKVERCR